MGDEESWRKRWADEDQGKERVLGWAWWSAGKMGMGRHRGPGQPGAGRGEQLLKRDWGERERREMG